VSGPTGCDPCLRRAWLVGRLAPLIERVSTGAPGRRSAELLALEDEDLAAALVPGRAPQLLAEGAELDPAGLRRTMDGAGVWAVCRHGRGYPEGLAGDRQAPRVLFGRGDPRRLDRVEPAAAVTLVGARRCSSYGREMARRLGGELAACGLAVVSGMALGIDSEAHEGALAAGGLTVAVLGSGPDVIHPPRKRDLYERLVVDGLVLSELPPGATPWRWTFPARNRIMAALGAMTVVVEARERSGSLITAEMAGDLGHDVGAVPGRVGTALAEGTNHLLREGAQVIRGAQDVIDSLLGPGAREVERLGPSLPPEQLQALELVERGALTADAVARGGRLGPDAVAAALAHLELLGYLRADAAGRYERTSLRAP
jgi:DNA processing protein